MQLLPIKEELDENEEFINAPLCQESLHMTIDFYKRVGFRPPWIGYYVKINDDLIGAAAFKGQPVNGSVEIAYGTFTLYRRKGYGTEICKQLIDLAQKTDPLIKITARTFSGKNFSTRILEKNNFMFSGTVIDPEDGLVWEWVFRPKE
ncbi:MAG: GNAT family protein [Ginsengibacter sp.]